MTKRVNSIEEMREYERKRKAAWRKSNPDKDRVIRANERANAKRERLAHKPLVYLNEDDF